jgi:hypothetical protein
MPKDVNFNKAEIEAGENKKVTVEGRLRSTSHDDYGTENNRSTVQGWYVPRESFFYNPEVRILGFHPYKEVIFLSEALEKRRHLSSVSVEKGLAYHVSTSKVEDLGNICPKDYLDFKYYGKQKIKYSFIYTPCWFGEFPRNS